MHFLFLSSENVEKVS